MTTLDPKKLIADRRVELRNLELRASIQEAHMTQAKLHNLGGGSQEKEEEETSGIRLMPVALAEEIPVGAKTLSTRDDSRRREVRADIERLSRKIGAGRAPDRHSLLGLCPLLGTRHVHGTGQPLHEVLVSAIEEQGLSPAVVLASVTAEAEMPHFERFLVALGRFVPIVEPVVHLVRWESFLDQRCRPQATAENAFRRVVASIAKRVHELPWPGARLKVHTVEIEKTGKVSGPDPFAIEYAAVELAANGATIDTDLIHDWEWLSSFYGRQRTLSKLGPEQAKIDLAIRRASGTLASAERANRIVLLSEQKARLARCYRTVAPAVNVLVG